MNDQPTDRGSSDYERGISLSPHLMDAGSPTATIPAGTLNPYDIVGRVIVPDELSREMSSMQIAETDFWSLLASRIADRMSALGAQVDSGAIQNMLVVGRRAVLGESQVWQPLDPWILERLGLDATMVSPDDVVEAAVARPVIDLPPGIQAMADVGNLQPADIALRHSGEGEHEIGAALPEDRTLAAGIALPPAPPNRFTPTSAEGQLVHLLVQQHYLNSHPSNIVMFENQVLWPGGAGSIQALGAIGALGTDFGLIRFALMTKRGLTKLPDILDVTLGEVYEIKPRAQAAEGLRQLRRNYLQPLSTAGLGRYRAGVSWTPLPVYPVPPAKLALVSRPAPGLIIYDLVPVPPPPPQTDFNWRWLQVTALAVVFAAAVLTPIPGDEAAVGAAILRLGLAPAF